MEIPLWIMGFFFLLIVPLIIATSPPMSIIIVIGYSGLVAKSKTDASSAPWCLILEVMQVTLANRHVPNTSPDSQTCNQ